MLDSKQQEWVAKVAKTLGVGKAEEDPKQHYEQTLKLLTPRFKQALGHDQEGVLGGKIKSAVTLAQQGSYADAQNILDDAGQNASDLIAAKMQPLQEPAGRVGKALPGKYKDEQYQKDQHGNVMHGGEFRGASRNRTKYYDDDERDASIVRTDDQGRMFDRDGNFLPERRGFVMSQDEGTLHTFDLNEHEMSPEGYLLHTHHSSPIQGESAAAAGEMETEQGVLRKVTDQSGHYRPTPEMTHQLVQSLQDAGFAMRDKKLTMHDQDGNPQPATPEIEALLQEVIAYHHQYQEDQQADPAAPYDPEMLKKLHKLRDLGVTESNREARVDLTNPKTFFTTEEFEQVKGNVQAIMLLVSKKIGKRVTNDYIKLGLTPNALESAEGINNWIGVMSRLTTKKDKWVNTKKTRLQMTTEQFAQTGGNVDAIRGKEAVNAEIQQQRKPDASAEDELARLKKLVENLGGDKKLKNLGVKDPTQLTAEQQFLILSKGRIPESLAEFGGGIPEIEDAGAGAAGAAAGAGAAAAGAPAAAAGAGASGAAAGAAAAAATGASASAAEAGGSEVALEEAEQQEPTQEPVVQDDANPLRVGPSGSNRPSTKYTMLDDDAERGDFLQEPVVQDEATSSGTEPSTSNRPGNQYTMPEDAKLGDSLAEDEEDEVAIEEDSDVEEDSAVESEEEDSAEEDSAVEDESGEEDSEVEEDSAEEDSELEDSKN